MALSPADFYAYSRATGVPVPENPQERAEMAPEVLDFRRNQLKASEQSPNLLQAVGATALAGAAAIGAGLAARRFMRGRTEVPQAVKRAANEGVIQQDLSNLRRAAQASVPASEPVAPSRPPLGPFNLPSRIVIDNPRITRMSPGTTENALPVDPTDRLLGELQEMRASQAKATRMPARIVMENPRIVRMAAADDLTTIQNNLLEQTRAQQVSAVESGEDQVTGRVKQRLQQNEDLDLSQIETLEAIPNTIAERLRTVNAGMSGAPEDLGGDGVKLYSADLNRDLDLNSPAAQRIFAKAGVTPQEAESYWMKKLTSTNEADYDDITSPPTLIKAVTSALPDGIPVDQTQVTIADPWGKPTFVPPQPVAETSVAKFLPPAVVSKRQKAQDFLTQQRQQLSMMSPGRRERALAQNPEVAEAMELYASTGDPSVLSRLSPTPSSPIEVQPVIQTELGAERIPTGKFFQPTGRNEFVEDLLGKDIDLTNKISELGARKQQVQKRLQEIDETEPMLRYAMAGERGEGGEYSKMFNTLQAEKQNLPNPESFDVDINDAMAERNFVRQRIESAQNLGSTYRMLNRQEGVRPFFEQTAEGEIIPETLEIRTGRPTIDTKPKSGGGRKIAEFVGGSSDLTSQAVREVLQGGRKTRVRDFDIETGNAPQIFEGDRSQTGSSIGIYGIESRNKPRASERVNPTRVTQRELVEEAMAKATADPYGDVPIPPSISSLTEQQPTQARKRSLDVSEALRRARIEGRDPNMILKQFGIGR